MESENTKTERAYQKRIKRQYNKPSQKDVYFLRQSPKTTRENSLDPQFAIIHLQKKQEDLGLPSITNETFLSLRSTTPSLMEAQKIRRNLDQDAQILNNRIRLLQLEEEKCKRKIELTNKKCEIVMMNKKRYQESIKLKNQWQQLNMQQMQVQKEKFQKRKQMIRDNIVETFQNAYRFKRNIASQQKQRKIFEEQKIRESEQIQIQRLSMRVKELKKEEEIRRNKLRVNHEQRILQSQINYINRVQEAEEEKQYKEREVLKMEKLEMEMIKRLKETQNLQKEAYINLEKALYTNSPNILQRGKSRQKRIFPAFDVQTN